MSAVRSVRGRGRTGAARAGEGAFLDLTTRPPADLAVLSQQNGGVFPVDRVKEAMYSTRPIPAHGTPEMPACGAVLDSLKSSPRDYEARVRDIAAHAVLIGREVVRRRDPPG